MIHSTIKKVLREQKLDSILLSAVPNIIYTTAFHGFSLLERDGYVLVTKKNTYLITSPLYEQAIKSTQKKGITPIIYTRSQPLSRQLQRIVAEEHLATLGFEADNLTVAEYTMFRSLPVTLKPCDTSSLRLIKATHEISCIRKAAEVADEALNEVLRTIRPGITERALANNIDMTLRQKGAEVAFPTIVAFGEHTAMPHHLSTDRMLNVSDTLLIDFGAKVAGYNSDMTRSFSVGKPQKEWQNAYHSVLTSQEKAASYIEQKLVHNHSISTSEIDAVSREYIQAQGYPSFPHSLGHGIGLAVHEKPSLSPHTEQTLIEGMVFSLEPGIYLPNKFGIRIEDLYTISAKQLVKLTTFPRELTHL